MHITLVFNAVILYAVKIFITQNKSIGILHQKHASHIEFAKQRNVITVSTLLLFLKHRVCSFSFSVNPDCPALNVNWEGFSLLSSGFESKVQSGRGCVWHEASVFEDLRRAFIVIEDLLQARNTCWLIVKCFSLRLYLSALRLLLSCADR